MNSQSDARSKVSNTLVISQVAAVSIYGVATAIISFMAGESLEGAIVLAVVAAMILMVVVFNLPAYFARIMSLQGLILIAMIFSVFALGLAISQAASFIGLPDILTSSPGTQNLMAVALLGVISFGTAFIINLLVAISAIKS